MEDIHEEINTLNISSESKKSPTYVYKTLVKFIMLVASASKVPIGSNLDKQTKRLVDEFGTVQHIRTWCFWTPQQLQVLSSPESMTRLVIFGGNGSGKTLVLKEMAKRMAMVNQNVIYIIFTYYGEKTLLYFQLQKEFEGTGIKIFCFGHQNIAEESFLQNAFVFCDETLDQFDFLKKMNMSVCSSIWMVSGRKLEELGRDGLPPEFQNICLDLALRTTKVITREVIEQKSSFSLLGNSLNKSLRVIEHMPEGKNIITIEGTKLSEMIEEAMKHFTSSSNILVCIATDEIDITEELWEELLLSFGEKRKPLIYFVRSMAEENDCLEEIQKWMAHDSSMIGRPLLANEFSVPGFEAEDVMGIGSEALSYFISRARVNFVHVDYEFESSF